MDFEVKLTEIWLQVYHLLALRPWESGLISLNMILSSENEGIPNTITIVCISHILSAFLFWQEIIIAWVF